MADNTTIRVVLVGTYWTGQFDRWHGYYNYPISDEDAISESDCMGVSELWLFSGVFEARYRDAEFVGVVTREELIKKYGYRPNRAKHAERYYLFRTKPKKRPSRVADRVLLRVSDFSKRSPKIASQLKSFLESPDRKNQKLAERLPKIVLTVSPEQLCLCERIVDYNRVSSPSLVREDGPTIDPTFERDVQECDIPRDVLDELLKDRTTGQNVLWMTGDYEKYASVFDRPMGMKDPILAEVIAKEGTKIIRPRVDKSKEEQRERVTKKAEVFTPSWICNAMNNQVDAAWFGLKESPFTIEKFKSWEATKTPIPFPGGRGETWQDFVTECRLEITCGEAPFLASRYDTTTGEMIDVPQRMGILDRKLRVVTEQVGTKSPTKWLEWAIKAVKGTWGYEWQGDNLVIARENILMTVLEHYKYYCHAVVSHAQLLELAHIISWNLWQMDGLKFVIPLSCHDVEFVPKKPKNFQPDLFAPPEEPKAEAQMPLMKPCPGCAKKKPLEGAFDHNGIYCQIMDWKEMKPYLFVEHMRAKPKKETNG